MKHVLLVGLLALALTACSLAISGTTDTANDAAAAGKFVPSSLAGYTVTDAANIKDALSKVGVSASLLSGNVGAAAMITRLDGLIACYQSVGAVDARLYIESPVPLDRVPKTGVLAVINTTRLGRDFLTCALGGGANAQASLASVEPCGASGSFKVSDENLQYAFAATDPSLCQTFQALFPAS